MKPQEFLKTEYYIVRLGPLHSTLVVLRDNHWIKYNPRLWILGWETA